MRKKCPRIIKTQKKKEKRRKVWKPGVPAAPSFASAKVEENKSLFQQQSAPEPMNKAETMEALEKKFLHPQDPNPLMDTPQNDKGFAAPSDKHLKC